MGSVKRSGQRRRASSSAPRIFQWDRVVKCFTLDDVYAAIPDGRDFGEGLVIQESLPEFVCAIFCGLGNDHNVGGHGDDAFKAGGGVRDNTCFFGGVDAPGCSDDSALGGIGAGGPDAVGIPG